MKFSLVLFVFLLALVLSSGCTTAPAPTASPTAMPSATSGAAAGTRISSDSPNTTLALDPGAIVVSFTTEDAQKMSFSFDPEHSASYGAGTVFTTNGPYTGSVAFQAPSKDTYLLNVTSSGRWTAKVAPLVTANPLKSPVNLSGTGTQVSQVFYLEKGEYFFERNSTGLASPYYFLQFANGSPLMDANNSYIQPGLGPGSPHPFVFVTVPENGTYFLSVLSRDNPGGWSVSISPLPKLPPMGPGPAISWSTGTPVQSG